MDIYFIFLLLKMEEGKIEYRALERPYYSLTECARVNRVVSQAMFERHPIVFGVACLTVDDYAAKWDPTFDYRLKRPL